MVRAEVDREDVLTEACEVIQLSEVALQRAAGKAGFVERGHKPKHKGIQTGWPVITNTYVDTIRHAYCEDNWNKAVKSKALLPLYNAYYNK